MKLSPEQRLEIVAEFFGLGKSSGLLARKYHISDGYVRQLAWLYRKFQRVTVRPQDKRIRVS